MFGSFWLSLNWRVFYKTYYLANYADERIQFIDPTHWQPINLNQSIEARTCSHWGTERQYHDLHRCHILCQWWWASQTCRQSTRRGHVGGTEQSLGLSRCWPGLQFGDRQDFCCHSAHLGDIGKVRSINCKTALLKVYKIGGNLNVDILNLQDKSVKLSVLKNVLSTYAEANWLE